jgi:hypothetical protein
MPKKCYSSSRSHSFFIIAVLFFFVAATADAYDVVLGWDPNAESDLAGYKIYGSEGSPGPPYDLIDTYSLDDIDPDNPTGQISDLDDRSEYYIVVTAYDLEGNESGYSNEVCVAGGIACASDTGDGDGGGGGGGGCLISAAADGPHLAAEMLAVLFFLGFFFICIALGSGHAKVLIYKISTVFSPRKATGLSSKRLSCLNGPF